MIKFHLIRLTRYLVCAYALVASVACKNEKKIENDSLIIPLGSWLNANDMNALRSPPPGGLTFLAGVEDLNQGASGYFKANLGKGTSVLISEIPNVIERNMYKVFKVY